MPTAGTSAHSFTLLHDSEADAFRAQVDSLGEGTTLLVDTYDIAEAVRLGVEIAGPGLGAVRLDSGDLGVLAHQVRAQLDELGATGTRIVVTSDLDEFAIAALAAAPVDGYGVGTELVTGVGPPDLRLRLQAGGPGGRRRRRWSSVAKKSQDKISIGGRKYALRRPSPTGVAEAEVVGIGAPPVDDGDDRSLLVPLVRGRRGRRPRVARRRPGAAPALAGRAAAGRAADVPRRAGDRDAPPGRLTRLGRCATGHGG